MNNSADKPFAVDGQLQPGETQSNSSSTPWTTNASGQVDYLISGDEPMLNTAISGTCMSFSPISKSTVQTTGTASYPSQQLNSRFEAEPIPDELKCPTPPTSTDDAAKLPPPLPPPAVHSNNFYPNEAVSSNPSIAVQNSPVDAHKEAGQDDFAKGLDGFVIGLSSPTREAATALQAFKSGGDTTNEKKSGMDAKSKGARTSATHPKAAASAAKPRALSRKKKGGNKKEGAGIETPGKNDILRGRGGYTNHHPGNIKFRNTARALRADYRNVDTTRQEKFAISVELVNRVNAYGGKFLEKGKDNLWHEMDEKAARRKASQVLREEKWD
ncbi:hypothetical protein QTG54_010319 [Skeletonema marinoi]|uniref:DUF6824 domain-containing protein n=1 Tax=Skeletonema marinoi TaxID=267567 RepID=A0AAD9DAW0_9STRA|nr:hypothetical protein QTG54_010319 [Skeletonema marinoi]|eukprot:scaffold5940_cov163-Skeletonema_marinoi.AAC.4